MTNPTFGIGTRQFSQNPGALGANAGGVAAMDFATPEDFGAIGDGLSHRIRDILQITELADLRAYNDGIYSFADNLNDEMDWLAWQAALYNGGTLRGRPGAVYKINRMLTLPCGRIGVVDASACELNGEGFSTLPPGANIVVNPSFDSGGTGWTQGTLTPRTDIVFAAGKASFTDPGVTATPANYGDFGQQLVLTKGRWTIRVYIKMSWGASSGYYGPPYMNMGFRPFGVGLGGYDWPHPLSFAVLQQRGFPFEGWVTFDAEVLEDTTTWLDIQGGNCDWEVQDVEIKPFLMNYMIWATGDEVPEAASRQYDVTTWIGGELVGPLTGGAEAGWSGPVVGAILHKNFLGEGSRCNFERVFIFAWDVGITLGSQAFLNYFANSNLVYCRTCIKFVTGSVNAGENFRVYGCIFANSGLILHAEAGGEWNFWGCSWDYSQQMMVVRNQAKISMLGHHCEFRGAETRLAFTSYTGAFAVNATLTGATSGATARLIVDRISAYGYAVIEVLSGIFVSGEAVTGPAGSAVTSGTVQFAPYHFDIGGGSLVDFHGELLQAGATHYGATHMFNLETNGDTFSAHDWWGYGLVTASDTLCTGAGRFLSKNFLGPGNANIPAMIMRNLPSDIYSGNGRIYGPGSLHDMGYANFANPADGIGILFGSYSSGAPTTRAATTGEQSVTADSTVYRAAGYGSLRLEIDPAYSGYARLGIFTPVEANEAVTTEYWIQKPAAKSATVHGPFSSAAPPDRIWVNTVAGSSVATIQDNQALPLAVYGPQSGWTVSIAGVTGNPGGIANAVWNALHTIVARTDISGNMKYTIDLGGGNIASSTAVDAGGTAIQTTYGQNNVIMFDQLFWVQAQRMDAVGRPIITQAAFQAEDTFRLPYASTTWFRRFTRTHYTENVVPAGPLTEDRYSNGRAPIWATHLLQLITWDAIREQDPAAPPPIYITDFFGNKL